MELGEAMVYACRNALVRSKRWTELLALYPVLAVGKAWRLPVETWTMGEIIEVELWARGTQGHPFPVVLQDYIDELNRLTREPS
jgi:hypothetical protein